MATYRVWHQVSPTFRDNTAASFTTFPLGFIQVATVEAQNAGHVFQLTNHIESDWTKNPEVVPSFLGGIQSTSVGDVIEDVNANELFSIDGIGFTSFVRS